MKSLNVIRASLHFSKVVINLSWCQYPATIEKRTNLRPVGIVSYGANANIYPETFSIIDFWSPQVSRNFVGSFGIYIDH